jgi:hypothetical protein
MKKAIVFSTAIIIVANLLVGFIASGYQTFNVIASSLVILLTGCLNYAAATITLKDAFRVAHYFLFSLLGIVMFLLMVFSPHQLENNWCVIVSLIIIVLEIIALYITYRVSKHIN